jgi:glutamyl-tRNA synthetase
MAVRTRFAPSPTGPLHIGGARTALFNYLFARHHGGQFLLRIEDTDRERSTREYTELILDSLDWLGLERDEPPVLQSTRIARHVEVAQQLLAAGHAYRCYSTQAELARLREQAMAERRHPRFDVWRDRDPADAPPGVPPAIRLKAPREGETIIEDLVQGTVRVANAELDDMIILRSDGSPTYNFSVVIDDHDMAISHVIRGTDHLTNTFRQVQVDRAMGWDLPHFAHIPLIHGQDGAKLSKRHGAQSVTEFREMGYLPEALCNYLLRLGWGHGDLEVIDRAEAIRLFDLGDVGQSPARMDYAKLAHLNGLYLRQADDERLTREVLQRLAHTGLPVGSIVARRVRTLMPGLKDRARTLAELAQSAAFLAHPLPLPMGPKATAQLSPEARIMLRDVAAVLAETEFSLPALEATLRRFTETTGRKLGQVAQPLRAALTGSTASPPIDAVLIALGRDETLARIRSLSGSSV